MNLVSGAQSVKSSRVVIDVCVAEGSACGGSALVKLSTPVTDAAAVALFAPLRDVKILELTSIVGVFGGFADTAVQTRFYRRLREYTGIWCCIHAHPVSPPPRSSHACALSAPEAP